MSDRDELICRKCGTLIATLAPVEPPVLINPAPPQHRCPLDHEKLQRGGWKTCYECGIKIPPYYAVEPPVLSREWLDAIIDDISVLSNKRPGGGGYWSFLDGARALRDAILESLSHGEQ